MKFLFTFFFITFCLLSFSQAPKVQWSKSLGGSSNDQSYSVNETYDGGYIIAGGSSSNDGDVTGNHGIGDHWLIKLKNDGTIEWQKSLGGSSNDEARSIKQTFDSGYIIAGSSQSIDGNVTGNHGGLDYWVVKLKKDGTIEWEKSLGGSGTDVAESVQQTADTGFIVTGYSGSTNGDATGHHGTLVDYWVVKLKSDGTIEWQKSLGGSNDDFGKSVKQTADGGYIVAGYSSSVDGDITGHHGGASRDAWIVKLKNDGSIEWQKSLGGTDDDFAYDIQQTSDGKYIIAGGALSTDGDVTDNHGSFDYWIVKLKNDGTIEWQRSFGGSDYEMASSVQQTSDGGYIASGISYSINGDVTGNHGQNDWWLIKLKSDGTLVWQKSLGGSGDDGKNCITETSDKGYIVSGGSNSTDGDVAGNHGFFDYWVVKLQTDVTLPISLLGFTAQNQKGNIVLDWQTAIELNSAYFIIERSNNRNKDFKEIGTVSSKGILNKPQEYSFKDFNPFNGGNYYRLKQVDADGKVTYSKVAFIDFNKTLSIKIYPNPVKDVLMLQGLQANNTTTISIIGLQGSIVAKTTTNSSNYTWNIKQLAKATYYIRIEANKNITTLKFVKE